MSRASKSIAITQATFTVEQRMVEVFNPATGLTEFALGNVLIVPPDTEAEDLVRQLNEWLIPMTKYRKMSTESLILTAVVCALAVSEARARRQALRFGLAGLLLGLVLLAGVFAFA